ncbi:hypothetical protein HYP06_gp081 [Vibrio phage vB_VspP_pVa5]|uniref:Uncharacterized protein n=1 Tax=Vibrio phage vB_VspP_pVa5 TaxID=1913109 RepID=A0A1J0GV92_9CAUD|nr:hypothetical protein HYP06_gp081 [Vibrio phage vB_VspP_pVa5]APC46096.1 hypothetical protein vBVspPpVa5_0092 [Vibrio phage vB_VspP_pVa5]
MIYDAKDIFTPWMLLKVGDDGYITHWSYWCATDDECYRENMFPTDVEDPVELKYMTQRYELKAEADTVEEIKLLLLLEK